MYTFAVANQKGGVGKTTTSITLGGILAKKNQRVLLIDLDPHGSLSHYLKVDFKGKNMGVFELFSNSNLSREQIKNTIYHTPIPNFHVMPASIAISTVDSVFSKKQGLGLILSTSLNKLTLDYDYVFIDCPPMIGVLMINALAACNKLLIPVQTEFLAINGLQKMVETLKMVGKSKKIDLDYLIIPTMFDKRVKSAKNALTVLRNMYLDFTWNSEIPIDTKLREASENGVPVSFYYHNSKGARAYNTLLKFIFKTLIVKYKDKAS